MTPRQVQIHRRIAEQSAHLIANDSPCWSPHDYPELWRLVQAANAAVLRRRRLTRRVLFAYEGKTYAVRFTSLDRILVEDRRTRDFIASSGFFAL